MCGRNKCIKTLNRLNTTLQAVKQNCGEIELNYRESEMKAATENSPLWHPWHFSVYLEFSVSFLCVETRWGAVMQLLNHSRPQSFWHRVGKKGLPVGQTALMWLHRYQWRTGDSERWRSLESKRHATFAIIVIVFNLKKKNLKTMP